MKNNIDYILILTIWHKAAKIEPGTVKEEDKVTHRGVDVEFLVGVDCHQDSACVRLSKQVKENTEYWG